MKFTRYRLTKEQSDEFASMVKSVIKRIHVSQTRLGQVAGYTRQTIDIVLNRREDTITRTNYMAIISALTYLVANSDRLDTDEITQIISEVMTPYCSSWISEF